MQRVKVTPIQAAEFMKLGYTTEMYVLLPEPENPTGDMFSKMPRKPSVRIHNSAMVLPTVEGGRIPKVGAVAALWPRLRDHFWKKNLTKPVSVKELQVWAVKAGGTSNMISQYLHSYACLRVLETPDG